jgi:hypothetical protein
MERSGARLPVQPGEVLSALMISVDEYLSSAYQTDCDYVETARCWSGTPVIPDVCVVLDDTEK